MSTLAKLSRPRLAGIHPRERLFARLDECRSRAAVWIAGPPGAGKTTLAASYLDARALPALWYQVDAGDADPASFFYYLAQGAREAGLGRRTHLPLLTPEYLGDLAGFARRWFRSLYEALPRQHLIVFDNLQEAPEASPFGALVRDAVSELPPGVNTILISRDEPPATHARLRASGSIAELRADELRFTEDEAACIAVRAKGAQAPAVRSLLERCGGWAAGLTLLLDHADATAGATETPRSRQALFDYFAGELFDRLPPETRHLLLRTALLPWVAVEMARSLSGSDQAATLLEGLRRKHLFTERRAGPVPSYQYHALFREFLIDRLDRTCTRSERLLLAHKSARMLAGAEQPDAALRLYLEAGDEVAAAQLVLEHAPELAAQGRLQTLAEWIEALSAEQLEALPWLGYWLGACEFAREPAAARARWEATYERFDRHGDTLGCLLAAAGIVESYIIEFKQFKPLDPWIERMRRLLDAKPVFPHAGPELTVLGPLVRAYQIRNADPGPMAPYVARLRTLLDATEDINRRIAGAANLLHYCAILTDSALGDALIAQIRPQLGDAKLTPINALGWLMAEELYHQVCRYDERRRRDAMQSALDVMEKNGLRFMELLLRARMAMLRMESGDLADAERHLARAVPAPDEPRLDAAWSNGMRSCLALLRGDAAQAVRGAKRLVEHNRAAGTLPGHGMALLLCPNALAAACDAEGALATLQEYAEPSLTHTAIGIYTAALIEADVHLAARHTREVEPLLRKGFAFAREQQLYNTLQWLPQQMSRLCAFALERDIEARYIVQLIRLRRLEPPSAETAHWAWPLTLHCLGSFEIIKDGEPLRAEGKAQRKPLALLKALVALGPGEVPEDKLIGIVWPEPVEGDEQKTFDVTLHRVRKLLGDDKAVRVADRKVSLDRARVWVDLWALDRTLAAVMPLNGVAPDGVQLARAAPRVLELYRGHLFHGEAEAGWLLPARNRLGGRFQRFVGQLGEHWEGAGEWGCAAQLYERAIELDPLAEAFYGRLMVCLREQGRSNEAIEAFRRCRQLLSLSLGTKPSQPIEAVYRGLMAS